MSLVHDARHLAHPSRMDAFSETERAELAAALDELLETEPVGEQGECPWCESIRAPWAGGVAADHRPWCPWSRLVPMLRRLAECEQRRGPAESPAAYEPLP
jgi:hypothetical protein